SKLIYSSEAPSVQVAKLCRLRDQLRIRAARFPAARVVGLVTYFVWSIVGATGAEAVPGCRAGRRAVPSRSEREACGLRNDFGHGGARWIIKSPPEQVDLGGVEYRVRVAMETVRTA